MTEEKKQKTSASESGSIDDILRAQERLNQEIREKFTRDVTVMFTDICGYTHYMDTMGDISGRGMLQKHNDIVLPIIGTHHGTVVKTIGDAVMAVFSSPLDAVQSAVAIQNALHTHNGKAGPRNRIYVKIGINSGEALVDHQDLFGDAVNVAARVQAQAGKEDILLSEGVYESVRGSEDILCRFDRTVTLKGKSGPVDLYRVVWNDEHEAVQVGISMRSETVHTRSCRSKNVFRLDISRTGHDRIHISAVEETAGQSSTIQHYEEVSAPMDTISARCREMAETLNLANRRGRVSPDILLKLRNVGQVLADDLFTPAVKEKLGATEADQLIVSLDDQLVQVPWELLHIDGQFLCRRFSMGRMVRTRQPISGSRNRILARPLKMMILSDPCGDLKGAYQEGTQIRDHIDRYHDLINASYRSGDITRQYLREKIRNFDLLHYAGHFDYHADQKERSGWKLSNGWLTAEDVMKMAGAGTMPSLVFSNACQSARTEEWAIEEHFENQIFGLANAFMLAGVKHYVGTFWEIQDELSRHFALTFYKHVLSGISVGEALRQSRLSLIKEYGEETIVWASYLLYGDPAFNYLDQIQPEEDTGEASETHSDPVPDDKTRSPGIKVGDDVPRQPKKNRGRIWMTAALLVMVLATVWGYPKLAAHRMMKMKTAAETLYQQGDFDHALAALTTLSQKYPGLRSVYVIMGDIHLRSGRLDEADAAFRKALETSKGTKQELAQAYVGLGRISSIQKHADKAVEYYQLASEVDPAGKSGLVSKAMLLERGGDFKQALMCLKKASERMPDAPALSATIREISDKIAYADSRDRQARIDQMVSDLLQHLDSSPEAVPSDGWTSRPLTLWAMDISTQGYSMDEGRERLLGAGICERFLSHQRIRLVERALLDELLEELKIGSSRLADRHTALSLGKMMAARLILFGNVIYSGPQTQISFRLIETETGRITASVTESFGNLVPVSEQANQLSKQVLNKIDALYPLRAVIQNIENDVLVLNIGSREGSEPGIKFKALNEAFLAEVISTDQSTCRAKVIEQRTEPEVGQRLEAI